MFKHVRTCKNQCAVHFVRTSDKTSSFADLLGQTNASRCITRQEVGANACTPVLVHHPAPTMDLKHFTLCPHRYASRLGQLHHWGLLLQNFLPAVSAFEPPFPLLPVISTDDATVSEDGARKRGLRPHHLLKGVYTFKFRGSVDSRAIRFQCACFMPLLSFGRDLSRPTSWTSLGIFLAFLGARSYLLTLA